MTVMIGTFLLFFALVGLVCAYRAYDHDEKGEALLLMIGSVVLAASGYAEMRGPIYRQDEGFVGAVIFLLAAGFTALAGRELLHRDTPTREEKMKCAGFACLAAISIAGGFYQLIYVVQ